MRALVFALTSGFAAALVMVGAGPSVAAPVVDPGSGRLIVSTGFDVKRDGFSFQNWGENDGTPHTRELTVEGLRAVFGDEVCARVVMGICSPTTVAETAIDHWNDAMSGGHCFGMAVLAGLYSTKKLSPFPLAMPWQSVYDMPVSAPLDELIARLFITQGYPPSTSAGSSDTVADTLGKLRSAWARGDNYVLGIFTEDQTAGHAITPIALRDLGAGKRGIVVYDNNYPGEEKMVVADPAANTWFYSTATNPDQPVWPFQGSESNPIRMFPLSTALARHSDPDLAEDDTIVMVTDTNGTAQGVGDVDWDVHVTYPDGRPMTDVEERLMLNQDNSVTIQIPAKRAFRLHVDSVTPGQTADIRTTILSSGGAVSVEDLEIPSQARATFDVDPARLGVTVSSTAPTTAGFELASENSLRSIAAETNQLSIGPGTSVSMSTTQSGVTLRSLGRAQKVNLTVERSDTFTDRTAGNRTPFSLPAGGSVDVPVGIWTGWEPIAATVRSGANSTPVTLAAR